VPAGGVLKGQSSPGQGDTGRDGVQIGQASNRMGERPSRAHMPAGITTGGPPGQRARGERTPRNWETSNLCRVCHRRDLRGSYIAWQGGWFRALWRPLLTGGAVDGAKGTVCLLQYTSNPGLRSSSNTAFLHMPCARCIVHPSNSIAGNRISCTRQPRPRLHGIKQRRVAVSDDACSRSAEYLDVQFPAIAERARRPPVRAHGVGGAPGHFDKSCNRPIFIGAPLTVPTWHRRETLLHAYSSVPFILFPAASISPSPVLWSC